MENPVAMVIAAMEERCGCSTARREQPVTITLQAMVCVLTCNL